MAMKIDRIQPAGMNVRMQQGKPAYSHVVTVTGPGKTIYIAGQLARDAEGKIVGPGDMRGSSCWSDWLPRSSAYARRSNARTLGSP